MSTNKSKIPLDFVQPFKPELKTEAVSLQAPAHFEYDSPEVHFAGTPSGIQDISDYELTTMVAEGINDITDYPQVDNGILEPLTDVTSTVVNTEAEKVELPSINETEPKVETVEPKTKK